MLGWKLVSVVAAITAITLSAPVFAATNLGFEAGSLIGWTASLDHSAATSGYENFAAVEGNGFGAVEAGIAEGVYSTLSQSFVLTGGGTISGHAAFWTADYLPFNDDGYLAVNGTNLLAWDVATVGNGGWNAFTFTATTAGTYTLSLGVANRGDNGFNSLAFLDAVQVTGEAVQLAVPEPASWAMMLAGFGLVGGTVRAGNRKRPFAA